MNAIVIGEKNGVVALLFEDGTTGYKRIKADVGSRIEVRSKGSSNTASRMMKAACAIAAMLVLTFTGGGYYLTAQAVSYVSVDVNPSLEFALNRLDHVINVEALNDDAVEIVDALKADNVRGDTLSEALKKADLILAENNYITGDDDFMLLSVACDNEKRSSELESELRDVLGKMSDSGLSTEILHSSIDERSAAANLSLSSGRYKEMIGEEGDKAADDPVIVTEYRTKPVHDMIVQEEAPVRQEPEADRNNTTEPSRQEPQTDRSNTTEPSRQEPQTNNSSSTRPARQEPQTNSNRTPEQRTSAQQPGETNTKPEQRTTEDASPKPDRQTQPENNRETVQQHPGETNTNPDQQATAENNMEPSPQIPNENNMEQPPQAPIENENRNSPPDTQRQDPSMDPPPTGEAVPDRNTENMQDIPDMSFDRSQP